MILESLRLQEMERQGQTVTAEDAVNAGQNMFAYLLSVENKDLVSSDEVIKKNESNENPHTLKQINKKEDETQHTFETIKEKEPKTESFKVEEEPEKLIQLDTTYEKIKTGSSEVHNSDEEVKSFIVKEPEVKQVEYTGLAKEYFEMSKKDYDWSPSTHEKLNTTPPWDHRTELNKEVLTKILDNIIENQEYWKTFCNSEEKGTEQRKYLWHVCYTMSQVDLKFFVGKINSGINDQGAKFFLKGYLTN